MPFAEIDTAGVARGLSQIVERPEDTADVFFELSEEIVLPAEGAVPGMRVRTEAGLAVRLARDAQVWLAGRDQLDAEAFRDAVRRVARAVPRATYPLPRLRIDPTPPAEDIEPLLAFPSAVRRAVRERQARVPYQLEVGRHRRWILVVGPRLASPVEHEAFFSVAATTPWGRLGTLLTALDDAAADTVAQRLVRAYRCREAEPPSPWSGPVVLGPEATAVLLHEAVAHALEADTLALGGHPEAAVGVQFGDASLNVLDDPGAAPEPVRRTVDDEGIPVLRRWLLRDGVVEQPLCDSAWARSSEVLAAGAGRRSDRHRAPAPRSFHLELQAGNLGQSELLADAEGGLYLPQAERGILDPESGRFTLFFPFGRRIHQSAAGPPVGRCALRGHVGDLLAAVTGIGDAPRMAGAGWCAKDGMRLPVWATAPALRLDGVEVRP